MENAGATKYGKPSEENTLKYQTKAVVAFVPTCRDLTAMRTRDCSFYVRLAMPSAQISESHSDADDDDDMEAPASE